ncbi:DUF6221 family protein [Nocardiopsis sp. CT-R113]|uniref:DUF6221 family protein n=1 Tax=Nocardiopsis codii TaxID=3065942 RepID=A0ABU7KCW1_9ACTN|nr:DUF6221 family protein [Nocardiopsis sp. CT-R113]MEE2040073.1 DUF6221 family protein [Nocardiopsis sp. CT-R113]
MTIVEFIRARLDEDETAARAATPGPWEAVIHRASPEQMRRWRAGAALLGGAVSDVVRVEVLPAIELEGNGDGGVGSVEDGVHIARWDPERGLREVAAKRAILAEHENGFPGLDYCTSCRYGHEVAPWPCPTVRALAAPWSDHPDYNPQWSPQ